MLRKLKQQKAFPARSLHLFAFVRKTTRKVIIKNSRFWDGTETFSLQISNSKRAGTKFKLKGKSVKMLRKFKQYMMFAKLLLIFPSADLVAVALLIA